MSGREARLPGWRVTLVGYAALGCLLVLAVVFYRERTLFVDVAFQTFLMITEGTLQPMVYRFGAVLVQWLPFGAIQLGQPLWVVLMAYSVSFLLLYLAYFTLVVRVWRNEPMGLAFVLLFTLFLWDGFYWTTSELQQALALLLVVWAYVWRHPALGRWWHWLTLAPACLMLAFYHPVAFIPFYFLWAFMGLRDAAFRHWRYLALAALMALCVGAKMYWGANWYDKATMGTFKTNLAAYFPHYWDMPSHGKFLRLCLYPWYGLPLALAVVTGHYLWRRQWLRLGLVWGACVGMVLLVHIGSPDFQYPFYIEVSYMPLAVFLAVPLAFDVLPRVRARVWLPVLVAFLVLRLADMGWQHRPFTARLDWLATQLHELPRTHGGNRFVMQETPALTDTLLMAWGTPYETLLLSALTHPDSTRTLAVLPHPARYDSLLVQEGWFLSEFRPYPVEAVDGRYFRLGAGRYVWVR